MKFAPPKQKFQDWLTQQWAILWGRKIDAELHKWLLDPFGKPGMSGQEFIGQIIKDENLFIDKTKETEGLIPSFNDLNLTDQGKLSKAISDFYERTELYELHLAIQWNPLFKISGKLINKWFSTRIGQLNIPTKNIKNLQALKSEIITLSDTKTAQIKYTIWYRTILASETTMFSGVYSTCIIPSGKTCIKASFPLPNGNATVILKPEIDKKGQFILNASGKTFGDPGFYFVLNDSKGNLHSQYIRSFRNKFSFEIKEEKISAKQILTLWNLKVLEFSYFINKK